MRDGKPTKNRLLIEAFKLFAHKPYDRVTFADLEEVRIKSWCNIISY